MFFLNGLADGDMPHLQGTKITIFFGLPALKMKNKKNKNKIF